MKNLILCILLVSCGPKFKAGDCVSLYTESNPPEVWETERAEYKILEVGVKKYRVQMLPSKFFTESSMEIYLFDGNLKVKCPKGE